MLTQCPECGYSLQGLPANHNCPECGLTFDEKSELYPWVGTRRARLLLIIAILSAVLLNTVKGLHDLTKGPAWPRMTMFSMSALGIVGCIWCIWYGIRVFRFREAVAILPKHLLLRIESLKSVKVEWHKIARIESHYVLFKSAMIYLHGKEKPLMVHGVFRTHEHVMQFIEAARARVEQAKHRREPDAQTPQ